MNHRTMRAGLMAACAAVGMLLASGCGYSKDIREYPEPWQTLAPGTPLEKFPKIEILEQGGGAIIEPGDLVQLHLTTWSPKENAWNDQADWWIWIGFNSQKETAFSSIEPDAAAALLGLKQGTGLRFLEGKLEQTIIDGVRIIAPVGHLRMRPHPFGNHEYYSWRKNINDSISLSTNSTSGYFVKTEIKRVCKGPLQYRTVRLFDDSPVQVCSGLSCYTSHKPREAWIDEARIEAKCNDGKTAVFEYGPTGSRSGGEGRSPVIGYFDDWLRDAWQKLPRGVQFKGNRPPNMPGLSEWAKFKTERDTPVRIDLSNRVSDPDGDKPIIRFIGQPANGTLAPNPDGSFIYTPKPGWAGIEELTYKVGDGLVEADGKSRVKIYVDKAELMNVR